MGQRDIIAKLLLKRKRQRNKKIKKLLTNDEQFDIIYKLSETKTTINNQNIEN